MAKEYVEPERTIKGVCWCFTHHAHDDCDDFPSECKILTAKRSDGPQIEMVAGGYGLEKCPTTGLQHMQGWLALESPIVFGMLKANFCERIHWEKMHGSIEENVEYCSKEGVYTAFGDCDGLANPHARKGQGARHDHDRAKAKLKAGKRKSDLWEEDFEYMMKYHRGINEYISVASADATPAEECHVLWGVAGSGKTATAHKIIKDKGWRFYEPEENGAGRISFESYDNQEVLLLNDFSADSIGVCTLKRILDPHYGATLPGRNRSVKMRAKMVIITSNYNPRGWFKPEEWAALSRRFTSLTYCGADEWENQITGEKFSNQWKVHLATLAAEAVASAVL